MKILKRNGVLETVSFDKILKRIQALGQGLEDVELDKVSQKVIEQIHDGISSKELDDLAAQIAISMSIDSPDYGVLAARLSVSNLHKSTPNTFHKCVAELNETGIVNKQFFKTCVKYKKEIYGAVEMERDYLFDYFGLKTLERSYLLRKNKQIVERPQYMLMRVAVALYPESIEEILECYHLMSLKYFTHASPTLFNAGTKRQQLSSCYLLSMKDDIGSIFKNLSDCAHISKHAGGIGLTVGNIRARGSIIRTTNGHSDGIIPMLKVYNETSRYVNQSSKRNGSFAVYIEPWHADIIQFLELKKNTGDPNLRARDLFFGLWIPDIFMKTVEADGDWYLMCPDTCPGLCEAYGEVFDKLYLKYVDAGQYVSKIKARELWNTVMVSQIETGTPYICYKDSVNLKNNQSHLGTILNSNLCAEIMLYTTPESTAVCNIATVSLPNFVIDGAFDFQKLGKIVRLMVRNLNKVIDINYYPTPETEHNNKSHRPISVGVQGLYNTFNLLRLPFDSTNAAELNRKIFQCIQYNGLVESCELAKRDGPYKSYPGSPMSKGIFQHNMWGVDEKKLEYDWAGLREKILVHGIRNSLITALPPTASTSQILGNVESFEVLNSNFYMRRVLSGSYPIINKFLVKDLKAIGLWTEKIKQQIIIDDGSVQSVPEIPDDIKLLYRTTWEISQKTTIDLSAARAVFIDHSQSLNIFIAAPTVAKLSSMHMYGWKKGLKTGCYYLRSLGGSNAEKFSIDKSKLVCSIENKDECVMCSG